MTVSVLGIGTALPEGSLTQDEAAAAADYLRRFDIGHTGDRKAKVLQHLYRKSGVQTRHSVLLRAGDETPADRQTFYVPATDPQDCGPTTDERMRRYAVAAPLLAERASRVALDAANLRADQIKHLVTVSCSGFSAPGFDLALYPALGLSPNTTRSHVGFMGCHGALNGLRVASALATANPGDAVLLCATELCTLHHQYTDDPQQIVANSLFADGAAAMVVIADSPSTSTNAPQLIEQQSYLLPDSAEMMTWRIGDSGFRMTLSARVPEVIKQHLQPWLVAWLQRHSLAINDIEHWAVHPGGPRILSATAESIGLPNEAIELSATVLSECGNMSSPTILFILDRIFNKLTGPCVALAFGPGLVVEAVLFR